MPGLLLIALLAAAPQSPPPTHPHPLQFSMTEDLSITAAAAAVWGAELLLKSEFAPLTCKWCDRNPDGTDSLNGLDKWGKRLIWDSRSTADSASTAIVLALPFGIAGVDWLMANASGDQRATLEDLVMIAQATAISGAINEGVKDIAGRQRPYAHYGVSSGSPSRDDNLSFYSGHSNVAFVLVTSAGTIAEMRGYPYAWTIWAVGMPLAGLTAYFRVAAAKHYLTDVIAGALVGGAIGAGVPLLFHHRIGGAQVQLVPGPGSVALVGIF